MDVTKMAKNLFFGGLNNTCAMIYNIANMTTPFLESTVPMGQQVAGSSTLGWLGGHAVTSCAYSSLSAAALVGNYALLRQVKKNEGEGPNQFHPKTVKVLEVTGALAALVGPVALSIFYPLVGEGVKVMSYAHATTLGAAIAIPFAAQLGHQVDRNNRIQRDIEREIDSKQRQLSTKIQDKIQFKNSFGAIELIKNADLNSDRISSLLGLACQYQLVDVVFAIMEHKEFKQSKFEVLSLASTCGTVDVVKKLLSEGVPFDYKDMRNAMEKKHYEVVKLLLEKNPNQTIWDHNNSFSIAEYAAKLNDEKLVQLVSAPAA